MSEQQQLESRKDFPNTAFDIVVVASSAGGLHALSELLSGLPALFPAAVVVVQHISPGYRSMLAHILSQRTALAVRQAENGDTLYPSTVFIAPPDRHLLVNADHRLSLSQTEHVHFVRPSADLLFESTAFMYGQRAIAVVLTGTGLDGAHGVQAIKRQGGVVIAQDEATSQFFGMPGAAIDTGSVDHILPLGKIAAALCALSATGITSSTTHD